mmetsp:Transcript_45352/g.84691  ORF Transcript_45352/g.84691 Transcript_45352/m.84691 type:complete len:222 (-) Transcript_45352:542-1207(-)
MPGYNMTCFSQSLVRSLSERSLASMMSMGTPPGPKSGPRCKRRYVLVRVAEDPSDNEHAPDAIDGHLATLEDTERLAALLSERDVPVSPAISVEASSDAETEDSECSEDSVQTPSRTIVQPQHHPKPGGPCDHCGAVESPQWRRGPSAKPMLCNACGTRFRRTNQLGPAVPSTRVATPAYVSSSHVPNKKRPGPNPGHSSKKSRCGPAGVHGTGSSIMLAC